MVQIQANKHLLQQLVQILGLSPGDTRSIGHADCMDQGYIYALKDTYHYNACTSGNPFLETNYLGLV